MWKIKTYEVAGSESYPSLGSKGFNRGSIRANFARIYLSRELYLVTDSGICKLKTLILLGTVLIVLST